MRFVYSLPVARDSIYGEPGFTQPGFYRGPLLFGSALSFSVEDGTLIFYRRVLVIFWWKKRFYMKRRKDQKR